MHPFALYLAATDVERNYGAASERNLRPRYASVDALPLNEQALMSRLGRLTEILRRRVARTADLVVLTQRTRRASPIFTAGLSEGDVSGMTEEEAGAGRFDYQSRPLRRDA